MLAIIENETNKQTKTYCLKQIAKRKKREREKGSEKIFEEVIAENFPNMGKGNSQLNLGIPESTRQDKPKEE